MASSTSSDHTRASWLRAPDARGMAYAAALLVQLQSRGAGAAAVQPLARSFARRFAQGPLPAGSSASASASASGAGTQACSSTGRHVSAAATRSTQPPPPGRSPAGAWPASTSAPPSNRVTSAGPGSGRAGPGWGPGPTNPAPSWLGGGRPSCSPRGFATSAGGGGAGASGAGRGTRGPALGTGGSPGCAATAFRAPGTLGGGGAPFRSFAASAMRLTPPAAGSGASAAATAAAAAARSGWQASHACLASVRHSVRRSVLETLAPYYGSLSWSALVLLLTRQLGAGGWMSYAWGVPGGLRQLHYYLLAAINVLANNLPVTLAVTVAELARIKTARADAPFAFYLDVPEEGPEGGPAGAPWWQALPLQLASLLASLGRTLWLLALFAPVLLSAPVALQLQWRRAEWMELMRATLEAAGPAFIKWGQWAATRHDMFPPDMCTELEKLHAQAPAHGFKYTRSAIEAAFGVPMRELFDEVDPRPVASGSIGQIHRAKLSEKGGAMTGMPAGTVVAVKVRHPGVGAAITRDFATMMAVAHLASLLPSLAGLRLEQTLSQFAAPLREQVDLSREAANLRRFNHNFRKTRHVFFPVPLYPLVTPDVLVETFETGEHITSYIQAEHNPYNHRLSELGSGTMLQMMLIDNLIHSDLHPGNILVRLDPPGGLLGLIYSALDKVRSLPSVAAASRARIELLQQRWLQPSLVLLDVGMATELSQADQVNMVGLFRSFAAMDGRACGDWTLRFSGASQSCPDPEGFRAAMQEAFDELHRMDLAAQGGDTSCSFKNGADALAAVLELVRQHQVSLPGHICAVVVTTLVLEGWSNKLDPEHSVLTQVQAMFEPETVPWSSRITALVDRVMEEEANHFALA